MKNKSAKKLTTIEVYRNNKFESHALPAPCVSAVKFTADGQMIKKTMCIIGDRHLKANLELPNLEERCDISSNKNLYKLSQELASSEAENNSDENDLDLQKTQINELQNYENNLPKYQNNLGVTKSARAHTKNHKSNQINYIADNLSKNKKSKEKLQKNYNTGYKMPKDIPVQSVKRMLKKNLRIRFENKKFSSYSSDESYDNAPRTRKNSTTDGNETQTLPLLDHLDQSQPNNESQQVTGNSPIQASVNENSGFNKLISGIKFVSKVIDDWYFLTPLLVLCIAFYLIYILFYDINIHVNKQRRYYEKMRSAPLVVKWFYYVMRLLKVQMF